MSLKTAGFSDVDILTGGFTASQLKEAGFRPESLSPQPSRKSTSQFLGMLRCVGADDDLQHDVLSQLFSCTGGHTSWKNTTGWKELCMEQKVMANATATSSKLQKDTTPKKRSDAYLLSSVFGVHYDEKVSHILRVFLPANGMKGTSIPAQGELSD